MNQPNLNVFTWHKMKSTNVKKIAAAWCDHSKKYILIYPLFLASISPLYSHGNLCFIC